MGDYAAALEAFEERLDERWEGDLGAAIDDPCVRGPYATLERRRLRLHAWLGAYLGQPTAPLRQVEALWRDLGAAWSALESVVRCVSGERSPRSRHVSI